MGLDLHPPVHEYRNRVHCVLMKLLNNEFVLQHSELMDYSVRNGSLENADWVSKTVQIVVMKGSLVYEYELHETRFEDGLKTLSLMMSVMDCLNNTNFACVGLNLSLPRMILDPEAFLQRWMQTFCQGWTLCVGSAPLQFQRHVKQQEMTRNLQNEEREVMNILGTALMNPDKFSHHYFFRSEVGLPLWREFIVDSVLCDFNETSYKSKF